MNSHLLKGISLLICPWILSGCLESDYDNLSRNANVSLVSVKTLDSETYRPGEPLTVKFSVNASGDADPEGMLASHVGVTFFLINENKAFFENEESDHIAGTYSIEHLVAGENTYTAQLKIPAGINQSGTYQLKAYVDPNGMVEGDDSEDNYSLDINTDSFGIVTIDTTPYHDFKAVRAEVGDGFLLLPATKEQNPSDAGSYLRKRLVDANVPNYGHTESDLIGYIDIEKQGLLNQQSNSAQLKGTAIVNGMEHTVMFWQEDGGIYASSIDLQFPDADSVHYFPWDIGIVGTDLYTALYDAYDINAEVNTFTLKLTVVDTQAVDDDLSNNTVTIDVPFAFFDQADEGNTQKEIASQINQDNLSAQGVKKIEYGDDYISLYENYAHTYGDRSKIAIGLDFGTKNVMYKNDSAAGGFASAWGRFPLYIFNHSVDLLGVNAEAKSVITSASGSWGVDVKFLGLTVLSEGDKAGSYSKEWNATWSERKALFSTTFVIAIVPIKVEAGVSGSIGMGAKLALNEGKLSFTGDIFKASMKAYAEGSVNLLVAKGGVGLNFTIIDETFAVKSELDLSSAILGNQITASVEAYNDLKVISGDFYIFVEYPAMKWFFKFYTARASKTLYNTGALYNKKITFLNASTTNSW